MTSIENWAFEGCTGLTSINIPDSMTSIGEGAFYGCKSLSSIDIPNSVTDIWHCAFEYCTKLASVAIPDSVTKIGWHAFYGCESLKTLHSTIIMIDDIDISYEAFEEFNIDNCTLYVPPGTRWAYRHHPVFGKFKNIEIETKKEKSNNTT